MPQSGVQGTKGGATNIDTADTPLLLNRLIGSSQNDYNDWRRNAYFAYQPFGNVVNKVTTRSNVYAVWITVGYFEVTPWYGASGGVPNPSGNITIDAAHPDGYQLGQELGADTGEITRHRGFYIIDRSIPVGFQRGSDLNSDKAVHPETLHRVTPAFLPQRGAEIAEFRSLNQINDISGQIVDAAMKVHSRLGPGLLESAYEACLKFELSRRGLRVESQVPLPVRYEEVIIDVGYRLDLLVDDQVIVELKAVDELHPIHQAQMLSYLKLSGKKLGLLINFHSLHLKDGIKRLVNNL